MKNIRQQRADERDKAAQIFTWCMVVAMHQEEGRYAAGNGGRIG